MNDMDLMEGINLTVARPQAWYHDVSKSGLRPLTLVVAAWQLLAALLLGLVLLAYRPLRRSSRPALITLHIVLLLVVSGLLFKLPQVMASRTVNPFTWKPDERFCKVHAVAIQFVISALPLVVAAIALDGLILVKHPGFYRSKMASLPVRAMSLLAPWMLAAAVTLGVVLHVMPEGGHLISGRCIPAFNSRRIVSFLVAILLGRFFVPLIAIIVSNTILLMAARRRLKQTLPPPGEKERFEILHACASVTVMSVLYVCMVGPHYIQLIFFRIPGIADGMNYHRLAHIGSIAVYVHEAFWNILPFIWLLLQVDIVLCILRRCSCCCYGCNPLHQETVDGPEMEMLTGQDIHKEREQT